MGKKSNKLSVHNDAESKHLMREGRYLPAWVENNKVVKQKEKLHVKTKDTSMDKKRRKKS
mgnify:CR=1 FL=1|jgi:hypothetical protein